MKKILVLICAIVAAAVIMPKAFQERTQPPVVEDEVTTIEEAEVSQVEEVVTATHQRSDITVSFIDIGQGDAILVEDNGHNMLVDTGSYENYEKLSVFLNKRDIQEIETLVLTHPDADHIQCAPEIIAEYGVRDIYTVDVEKDTKSYEHLINAINIFGVNVHYPVAGDKIPFGTASYDVLGPVSGANYENVNSYSLVLKITNNMDTFLLAGDATGEETDDIMAEGYDLSAMVLKASHHGSANDGCNNAVFMGAVHPSAVVISCGLNNPYGHPHRETKQLCAENKTTVLRTDILGDIVFNSNGEVITLLNLTY